MYDVAIVDDVDALRQRQQQLVYDLIGFGE